MSILIVEDSLTTQRMLVKCLEPLGTIYVAKTLQEARKALLQNTIHLIVADFRLPDGNATDLMLEVRGQHSPLQLPIIIVSSDMDKVMANAMHQAGANANFSKPVNWPELLSCAKTMLSSPVVLQPAETAIAITLFKWRTQDRFFIYSPQYNFQTAAHTEHEALKQMEAWINTQSGAPVAIGEIHQSVIYRELPRT